MFVEEYYDEHGYPPTIREIADGVGLRSAASTSAHLGVLVRVGRLRRRPVGGRVYAPAAVLPYKEVRGHGD